MAKEIGQNLLHTNPEIHASAKDACERHVVNKMLAFGIVATNLRLGRCQDAMTV